MRRRLFSSFLLFLLCPALIFAQRDSLRNIFLDAESWFLFEEYADALPLYESLLKADPGNDNLNYKIGICLLNDPYQKDKAIRYLLDASNNINPNYKENSLKERSAPPDVLYYLGNAYLVNELLDRAIGSYEEFLEVMNYEVYDEELVLAQIRSCKNAQRLLAMPVDFDLLLIDSIINTPYSDKHPVVSGDGTKMAYVTELPFYDGAFFSEKTEDGWSSPRMITQMLGFDADVYPVALSYDGTEMILYCDDDYIGNLYYSRMEDGLWMPASKMGENISTKYWESHASFSKDGQMLYFTSNRKGTHGGLDIYMSEKQGDGKWGPPVNLGSTINTRYNEECPYISEDGQTLYFSSYGHYNMGGYDIFYSRKQADGSWAEPVNIGYPINTTDDDLFFHPINNGNNAYYAVYSPRGIGRHDIYYMNIYSVENPRFYSVSGSLRAEDGRFEANRVVIHAVDVRSGDSIASTSPTEVGEFAFRLKQGLYELHFKAAGYQELIRPLEITGESNKQGIILKENLVLLPLVEEPEREEEPELFVGDDSQIKLRQTQVEGVAGVPVLVPVIAPRGSILVVRTYRDSLLVITDTLVTDKRRTELQIIPLPGTSKVELELTDKEGNIHRNHIFVVGRQLKDIAEPESEDLARSDEQPQVPEEPDLGSEGISIRGNLILLLQKVAEKENFTTEDLSKAIYLGLEQEGLSEKELFEHLYEQAGTGKFPPENVDALLSERLSENKAKLLLQQLTEQSYGALKAYLERLELEPEGIRSSRHLLSHLEQVAAEEGFTMAEVRAAMLESLENPLEVSLILEDLLQKSEGKVREILESLDLWKEEVYTADQLKLLIARELKEDGMGKKEMKQILGGLFPGQVKASWLVPLIIALGGAGLIWFIISWWKRHKNRENRGD